MTINHRSNDPPTSAIAGREFEASGAARAQRDRCLTAVAEHPGETAREIEQRIGIKAHKRLPELREAGLVRNGSARTCDVSGRQALTWHLAGYRDSVRQHLHDTHDHVNHNTGAIACL